MNQNRGGRDTGNCNLSLIRALPGLSTLGGNMSAGTPVSEGGGDDRHQWVAVADGGDPQPIASGSETWSEPLMINIFALEPLSLNP